MPRRDADLLAADILEAATKIMQYTEGMNSGSFCEDSKTSDAVVRNLEIIGEASKYLPASFTANYPQVPWRQIAGRRLGRAEIQ